MRNETGGAYSTNGRKGFTACNVVVEISERRSPFGKPRYRGEKITKKDNQEIGREGAV